MLKNRIRFLNKYVTNRVLRGLASLPLGPFAIIRMLVAATESHQISQHSIKKSSFFDQASLSVQEHHIDHTN